jgi:diacylglycerol kinase (ATP)
MPGFLRRGALPYVAGVLRQLVANASDELTVHLDNRLLRRRSLLVAVANFPYYGGGMRICPDASAFDGVLDVCIVGAMRRRDVLRLLPKVFAGGHRGHRLVEFHRARTVRVDGPRRAEVQVDGELLGPGPIEFRCLPGALPVVVPASAW